MDHFYTVHETQSLMGDLVTVSDFLQAQEIAEDFASMAFPQKDFEWINEQYVDKASRTVYIRIEHVRINDFAAYLHKRQVVQQFLAERA